VTEAATETTLADILRELQEQRQESDAHRRRVIETLDGLRRDMTHLQRETDVRLTQYYLELDELRHLATSNHTEAVTRIADTEARIKELELLAPRLQRLELALRDRFNADELDALGDMG